MLTYLRNTPGPVKFHPDLIWNNGALGFSEEYRHEQDTKAELSQRWPRDAPYSLGALKIFGIPCMATTTANFSDIFNGLLFRSIPWLCVQNLKFIPPPAPEVGLIVIDCGVLGGGFKAQSSAREGGRGSGMEPFEKALMSSYRQ